MTDHDEQMRRRYRAAASNLLIPAEAMERIEAPQSPAADRQDLTPWNPEAWDGLTEEQAFEEDPLAVIDERGRTIASVTWAQGSWAEAYEYRGRFYAQDEVEFVECDSAAEALERAGVDRDWYDEIESQWVDPDFEHLLEEQEQ